MMLWRRISRMSLPILWLFIILARCSPSGSSPGRRLANDAFIGDRSPYGINETGLETRPLFRTCTTSCQIATSTKTFVDEIYGANSRCFEGTTHKNISRNGCFGVQCLPSTSAYIIKVGATTAQPATQATCTVPGPLAFPSRSGLLLCEPYSRVCSAAGGVLRSWKEQYRIDVNAAMQQQYPQNYQTFMTAFDQGRFMPHVRNGTQGGQYFVARKVAGCAFPWAAGLSTIDLPALNLVQVTGIQESSLLGALSVQNSGCVSFLEQDWNMFALQPPTLPWGLDKVDGLVNNTYKRFWTGKGVDVYVIDTGIDASHPEIAGRVGTGQDFTDAVPKSTGDVQGHGTHVAGTVGGTNVGMAPEVTLIPLKTLGNSGKGSGSWTLAAVNFLIAERQKRVAAGGRPMVASASLGGPFSPTGNKVWKKLVDSGVTAVVAAGNENRDASTASPASEPAVITVGASDENNQAASFSNFGSLIDVWAAGVRILSAKTGGGYSTKSGTSMAAPMVSGGIAQMLQARPQFTPAQLHQELVTNCQKDVGALKQSTGKILRSFAAVPALNSKCVLAFPATTTPAPGAAGAGPGAGPGGGSSGTVMIVLGILILVLICISVLAVICLRWDDIREYCCPASSDSDESSDEDEKDRSTYYGLSPDDPPPPPPPESLRKVTPAAPFAFEPSAPIYPPLQGPQWDTFQRANPGLAQDILACAECNADPARFENDSETVFKSLRQRVIQSSQADLSAVPDAGRVHVWDFLARLAEKRRFYKSQAREVSKRLQAISEWTSTLAQNRDIKKRKQQFLD